MMDEQWVGYMMDTDQGAMSCLINIAFAEAAPDARRPVCARVRIPLKEPGEDGLGGEEERDILCGFEDAMEDALGQHGVVHVATVRGGGALDVWFYSPSKVASAIGPAAERSCVGYEVESASLDDPEWEQYGVLFPEREDIAAYYDAQLISTLEDEGDRLDAARPVDHMLFLPSEAAAESAISRATAAGYVVSEQAESDDEALPVGLQLTKEHAVDLETVTRHREELTAIADELEGEYDGWQTPLVR